MELSSARDRGLYYQWLLQEVHSHLHEIKQLSYDPTSCDITKLDRFVAELLQYYESPHWHADKEVCGDLGCCPTALYCEDCVYEVAQEAVDALIENHQHISASENEEPGGP